MIVQTTCNACTLLSPLRVVGLKFLTLHFEQPTTANIGWSFVTIRAPISSYLSSVNVSALYFLFSIKYVVRHFPTVLHTVFLQETADMRYRFTKLPATLLPRYFAKVWPMKTFFDTTKIRVCWAHLVGIWVSTREEAWSRAGARRSELPTLVSGLSFSCHSGNC